MKKPTFDRISLQTDHWRKNAETLRADNAARRARWHRNAFPFLVLLFVAACIRLVFWINSLP